MFGYKQCWALKASNKIYWNWKFYWKELEVLEDIDLPMFYGHWKLPIKFFGTLDINCSYFQEKIGSQEKLDDIINFSDNEMEEVDLKRQKVNKDYEEEVASVRSFGSFVLASSSSTHFNSKPNTIKNNLICTPTKNEIPKFKRLLLRMSVANALSDHILKKEIKSLNTLRDEKLISDKIGVVLAFDGWKNILNQHIFGSLFISSSGEILIWDTLDISSEHERTIEVVPKITSLIQHIKSLNIKLNAIVSDSASAYAAARRRLQLQFSEIVFLPCFAHQCQLAIGDIFKESPTLKAASSKAITNLAIRHERSQTGSENTEELYLNSGLCQILLDNDWWEKIELLQDILLPYCGVLNKLQCDKARLFEVLHAIGYFMQFWKHFPDSNLSNQMISQLEKCWSQWEQPLFLLSFVLHPKYRFTYFNSELNNLSFTFLGRYLIYYYKAWFKKCPLRLLLDFEDYRQKIEPFNNEILEQFGDDAFKFWGYVQGDYKELAAVALKLFGMCVNAASVERMWSSMGFLHMAHRNRLKNKKVLAMSQLRAAINFSLREKELQQNQIQFSDPNTIPIDTGSEDATSNLNVEEIKDDIEDNTIFTSEHWDLKEDLLNEYTHPAVDKKAKWELKNLFSSSLSIPNYLDVKSN
ncbi:ribonuclease H-like domain-containing protein [Rhizophagus clarus]|uniref:Ribonuclease H-like domain-containing protein n=1 Tax=Rhizophagus clarus TaxID=94130 RepID=A0A8H3KWK7_9GLOM|nr:ribonuclease H-like domain-containing protein [Rhizophagus clarus]